MSTGNPWDDDFSSPVVPETESVQVDILAQLEAMARAENSSSDAPEADTKMSAAMGEESDTDKSDTDAVLSARALQLFDEEKAGEAEEVRPESGMQKVEEDTAQADKKESAGGESLTSILARLEARFGANTGLRKTDEGKPCPAVDMAGAVEASDVKEDESDPREVREEASVGGMHEAVQVVKVPIGTLPRGFWRTHEEFDRIAALTIEDDGGHEEETWEENWDEEEASAPSLPDNAPAFTSPRVVRMGRHWPPYLQAPFGSPKDDLRDAIAVLAWPPEGNDEERASAAKFISDTFEEATGRRPNLDEIVGLWWKAARRLVRIEEAWGRPGYSPNAFCAKAQTEAALSFLDAWGTLEGETLPAMARAGFPVPPEAEDEMLGYLKGRRGR